MQSKLFGSISLLVLVILCCALTANAQNKEPKPLNETYIRVNESTAVEMKLINQTELKDLKTKVKDIHFLERKLNKSVSNATILGMDFLIRINNSTKSQYEDVSKFVVIPVFPYIITTPEENEIIIHCAYMLVEYMDEITGEIKKVYEEVCSDDPNWQGNHEVTTK
jgi:hypothetical protein